MEPLSIEYWMGFACIIIILAILGYIAAKKVQSADDFALAGRKSGSLMVMGSLIGTSVGASSTVGTVQLAFKVGISAGWFCLGMGLAFIIMSFLYAKPISNSNMATISQFLTNAYGKKAGIFASSFSVLGMFFSATAGSLVLIPMISSILSVDVFVSMLITLLLIIFYLVFGGAWATGMIGIFKAALLYIVLGSSLYISVDIAGGVTTLLSNFDFNPWFNMFSGGIFTNLGLGLSTVVGAMSTQTYIQSLCSAKDEKSAKNGALLGGIIAAVAAIPAVWIGLFMQHYHPDVSSINALQIFIINYLPPWFAGISIAMLLIAAVGSAAGIVLGMSTIISSDVLILIMSKFHAKNALFINRFTIFIVTCIVLFFTYMNRDAIVLDWAILSMCLRGAGVFIPFILSLYKPGFFKHNYAIYAIIFGSLGALLSRVFISEYISPLYPGMLLSGIFMFLGYNKKKIR